MTNGNPSVALVSGFWGQNIGNAFFNLGGYHLLSSVLGNGAVALVRDQPNYRTLRSKRLGNPTNDFDILSDLDVSYLVMQGPVLSRHAFPSWADTIARIRRNSNMKVVLLGVGLFKYTHTEVSEARRFLKWVRPEVIVTRDTPTHAAVGDLAKVSYDGIDSGFFVSEAYRPATLKSPKFVLGFDRRPEPRVRAVDGPDGGPSRRPELSRRFFWRGRWWELSYPRLPSRLAKAGKWQAYVGHALHRSSGPERVDGYEVVRPEHRYIPHVTPKIYQRSNGFVSEEPWSYLAIYAASVCTLSDRVHGCVAALAYGNPAMLCSLSPRASLLDRVGLREIGDAPMALSDDRLASERAAEREFLSRVLD